MAGNYSANDNTVRDAGEGNWVITVYEPSKESIGPITGILTIGKDFHMVSAKDKNGALKCIASFPSQNVAYVLDAAYHAKGKP